MTPPQHDRLHRLHVRAYVSHVTWCLGEGGRNAPIGQAARHLIVEMELVGVASVTYLGGQTICIRMFGICGSGTGSEGALRDWCNAAKDWLAQARVAA